MFKKKKVFVKKGLLIIYDGRGKGKTTAAMGLAVRAAGMGLNVYIAQFIKGEWPSGEKFFFDALTEMRRKYKGTDKIGRLDIFIGGRGFVKILGDKKPMAAHKIAARQTLLKARRAILSKKYDLVILDEIISAQEFKLLKVSDLLGLVRAKPSNLHLVMTGHRAPKVLISKADLVSEVKMVKHPYYQGFLAQRGIDY